MNKKNRLTTTGKDGVLTIQTDDNLSQAKKWVESYNAHNPNDELKIVSFRSRDSFLNQLTGKFEHIKR